MITKRQIDKVNGHPIFKMHNSKTGLLRYVVHVVNPAEPERGPNRFRIHTFFTLKDARLTATSLDSAEKMIEAHAYTEHHQGKE